MDKAKVKSKKAKVKEFPVASCQLPVRTKVEGEPGLENREPINNKGFSCQFPVKAKAESLGTGNQELGTNNG